MSFFNKKLIRLQKSVEEVSPQITISESKKSGRERLILLTRFIQKQLQIHDGTKNRLNTLSHRLLLASLEVLTKYYIKIEMM